MRRTTFRGFAIANCSFIPERRHMTTESIARGAVLEAPETATRSRMGLLAIVLGFTAIVAVPAGVLWPDPASGSGTYTYADILGRRELWWGLLTFLAVLQVCNVPLQALATMSLVRRRGSAWATLGGALMWVGCGLQATGIALWAGAYYFPLDPSVSRAAGTALFDVVNKDITHIFAIMISGAMLVILGSVFQAVGLFRAKAVPVWVPLLTLFTIATLVVPGSGLAGMITSIPMAAGAVAVGYYAWRRAGSLG
jgi:hypothetical protein